MEKNKIIHTFGDICNKSAVEINEKTTVSDILSESEGMKENRKLKVVQIGGPLGICIPPKDISKNINEFEKFFNGRMIAFLNDLFCPVDYMRFLTRFLIRELRIDNDNIRKLNQSIEKITQGRGDLETLEEIKKSLVLGKTVAEKRLADIFLFLLDEFKDEVLEHILDKKCSTGICRTLITAQCINACPAEVYIPGYIELMKNDQYEKAYDLMRKNNPLSFICGKICARPCEERCRRKEIESTVGVRALKRFTCDLVVNNKEYTEDKLESNSKKIAVVGGGPAGISASYYLARTGYSVTIYEASSVIGGMLAMGIPEYRLPQKTIDDEVELITNLGVKIIKNTKIGKDISLKTLRDSNDAVLLASGCHMGNKFGPESENIEPAVKFLKEVKIDKRKTIGETVLVIGGGDVAMDAARTALRLEADVIVASLESFDQMPSKEEKHEAGEEGVNFLNQYGIKTIEIEGEKLLVTLKRCLILEKDGRFDPQYDEDDIKTLEVDNLIMAIGQRPDNSYLDEDIKTVNGWVKTDKYSFKTTAEGVYAIGDMYRPGIAIKAIAEAKKAAAAMDEALGGDGLYLGEEIEIPERPLNCQMWEVEKADENIHVPQNLADNFELVSVVYTREEAKKEAGRCMRCDRNSIKPLHLK
ncbi:MULTISPECIES: FAD-dependent oxidoreductase [Psychrilyobacter]|uniref:dihydrouracil dehydrogenase (NAD(+)) n=1 Tax=Psychrilyobacter piezotolerans TaxID=2293438 RepID=A0ABX9KFT0_9FUSO|nr:MULTISPECIES: FAD-dependent oxidoreductase [Psychrilyobacter]MCS5420886.1 FAD-dependent oxidoreductase [Psychrilyobacter sp. S5]NDI78553.1 FAD-dependent oxidoreductase [Psychrilyobacter piezotolerans]RDE60440.1 FAD-dependent oxidoreductase [Psychrilyobacter sp. S5]REI40470.1 FAD-dependent oxidoreductase [Psychrilyobacter piezotolerans]